MANDTSTHSTMAHDLIRPHADQPAGLLAAFHALHDAFGYVDGKHLGTLAEAFQLSEADVAGVLSFFKDFRTSPAPAHVVKICTSEACRARGAMALVTAASNVERVDCLGFCSSGPALVINGKAHARVTPEKLAALLGEGS